MVFTKVVCPLLVASLCLLISNVNSTVLRGRHHRRHFADFAVSLDSSLNLHGGYNHCLDPYHHGDSANRSSTLDRRILWRSLLKMLSVRDTVNETLQNFTQDHTYAGARAWLANQELSDYVNLRPVQQYANNITRIYTELRAVTYLFRVFHSDGTRRCCIQLPTELYNLVKNRVVLKWFNIQSHFGEPINPRHCLINAHVIEEKFTGCEDVRDFEYVILKHAVGKLQEGIVVLADLIRRWPA